jgi:hypothetical protein
VFGFEKHKELTEKECMRSDMKKVVVERPRWGSRVRNNKFGARLRYIEGHDYEEQPKKPKGFESYHDGCGKMFTDVLGPLARFLRSNLGRPWDKVYGELCAGLDKRKATGLHIFQHLERMVSLHCYFGDDRKVYSLGRGRECEVQGYYVHPRTGLLCEVRRESKRERRLKAMRAAAGVSQLYLDDNTGYQKHEGIWYRVKLTCRVVHRKERCVVVHDIFLKRKVHLHWGVNWIAVEKKQCNHQELKAVQSLLESGRGREPHKAA